MVLGLIAVALVAAYSNSFGGVFILDDEASIVSNQSIRKFSEIWFPPLSAGVGGRPVLNATFGANYLLGGLELWGFHAVNLLIHIGCAWIFFGVVKRSLNICRMNSAATADRDKIAFAAALLWAVNPVHTASVTYLSQRAESLVGLFYLLCFYAFLRSVSGGRWSWRTVSVLACFAGALTKQTISTAPLIIFLFDAWFVSGSWRNAWKARKLYYVALASSWIVILYSSVHLVPHQLGFRPSEPWWSYPLISCRSILIYLKLAAWPGDLVFDYGYQNIPGVWTVLGGVSAVILAVTAAFLGRRKFPAPVFLVLGFFLILSPTTSIFPVPLQPIAENRLYLSLACSTLIIVVAAHRFIRRIWMPVILLLVSIYISLTFARNQIFKSSFSVWKDTTAKVPANFRAHTNLGATLLEAGKNQEAKSEFETALSLDPSYPEANNDLGSLLMEDPARLKLAVECFERALISDPRFKDAHVNLGIALSIAGDVDGALSHLNQAILLDPYDASSYYNRGLTYLKIQNRSVDARSDFMQALRLEPDFQAARAALSHLQ